MTQHKIVELLEERSSVALVWQTGAMLQTADLVHVAHNVSLRVIPHTQTSACNDRKAVSKLQSSITDGPGARVSKRCLQCVDVTVMSFVMCGCVRAGLSSIVGGWVGGWVGLYVDVYLFVLLSVCLSV